MSLSRLLLGSAAGEEGLRSEEERVLAGRMEKLKEAKAEKLNITDFDAHIMQQVNREQNPAYSITTATDTRGDVVTHFQVNVQDEDEAALMKAIEGSRERTGKRHEVVGFLMLSHHSMSY